VPLYHFQTSIELQVRGPMMHASYLGWVAKWPRIGTMILRPRNSVRSAASSLNGAEDSPR